jgi:hypothetical protein
MFDYQAGEKYRLTLIMVALAGLMAGIFFTVLLMPQPEPQGRRHRPMPAYMSDPDTNGGRGMPQYAPGAAEAMTAATPVTPAMDPNTAKNLIESWLPMAWDLSAGTAKANQEKAMAYMTPECAAVYRSTVWTPELAQQIEEAGLKSSFAPSSIRVSDCQADGSVIVFVDGVQNLVAAAGNQSRPVKLEYLVRLSDGVPRICGISEGGSAGSGT